MHVSLTDQASEEQKALEKALFAQFVAPSLQPTPLKPLETAITQSKALLHTAFEHYVKERDEAAKNFFLQATPEEKEIIKGIAKRWQEKLDGGIDPQEAILLSKEEADLLHAIAYRMQQATQYTEAAAMYRCLLQSHPFHLSSWLDLTECLVALGDLDQAESFLLCAQAFFPEHPLVLLFMGRFLLQQRNDPKQALPLLNQAKSILTSVGAEKSLAFAHIMELLNRSS